MLDLRWAALTDVGRVRSVNQDAVLAAHPLFAVADGMGGHAAGDVAAATALDGLRLVGDHPSGIDLAAGVRRANQLVYERAQAELGLRGMGTTLCAMALYRNEVGADRLSLVNVGDSRAYRWRTGELRQLTRDHSYVADLVAAGQITAEEALHHPNRNMLTRALGVEPAVAVDAWDLDPEADDRYLLCSDGLFNEVSDERIGELLGSIDDPDLLVEALVAAANAGGGRDNISAVVVDVVAVPDGSVAPPPPAAPGAAAVPSSAGWADSPPPPPPPPTLAMPATPPPRPPQTARPAAARHRRFTWRVGLFLGALVAVLIIAAVGVVRYGRDAWFVTLDQDQVALYRGHPGGFLWMDPELEQRYPLASAAVPPAELPGLQDGREFSSRAEAVRYVCNLAFDSATLGLTPTELGPAAAGDLARCTTDVPTTTSTTAIPTTTTLLPTTTLPPATTLPATVATTAPPASVDTTPTAASVDPPTTVAPPVTDTTPGPPP